MERISAIIIVRVVIIVLVVKGIIVIKVIVIIVRIVMKAFVAVPPGLLIISFGSKRSILSASFAVEHITCSIPSFTIDIATCYYC